MKKIIRLAVFPILLLLVTVSTFFYFKAAAAEESNVKSEAEVIADLGISSKIGLASSYKSRCGTPGYIAPEIINAE